MMSVTADMPPSPVEDAFAIPQRADARRNRARILSAAAGVFAQSGLGATMPEIASAAGLGKGSLYRNFATKSDLVDAVIASEGAEIAQTIAGMTAASSPPADLTTAVQALFSALAENSLLADALADGGATAFGDVLAGLWTLAERGKSVHSVRTDLTLFDLRVVLCGAVRQLRAMSDEDPAHWQRAADLVVHAFAP
jgi:AcrR family transcriptional regulator